MDLSAGADFCALGHSRRPGAYQEASLAFSRTGRMCMCHVSGAYAPAHIPQRCSDFIMYIVYMAHINNIHYYYTQLIKVMLFKTAKPFCDFNSYPV